MSQSLSTAQDRPSWFARALDSDLVASFRRSKVVMVSAAITLLIIVAAVLAPVLSPQNPYDPSQLDLLN